MVPGIHEILSSHNGCETSEPRPHVAVTQVSYTGLLTFCDWHIYFINKLSTGKVTIVKNNILFFVDQRPEVSHRTYNVRTFLYNSCENNVQLLFSKLLGFIHSSVQWRIQRTYSTCEIPTLLFNRRQNRYLFLGGVSQYKPMGLYLCRVGLQIVPDRVWLTKEV